MKKSLTCIVCPMGCSIVAEMEDGKVKVEGNQCPRGKKYAENECISPMRTLTTTVRCKSGEILPLKTEKEIPKERIFEAMEVINKACPVLPIAVDDVIIENVFGSNVVATRNIDRGRR